MRFLVISMGFSLGGAGALASLTSEDFFARAVVAGTLLLLSISAVSILTWALVPLVRAMKAAVRSPLGRKARHPA